jgi:transcriptional regulator with XRE-family HTH domain
MGKARPWRDWLQETLTDPELRAEWERTAVANAVAIWLCGYRAEHGLTQEQLAARLGMKQAAVARMELGEVEPKLSTLLRVANALGVPLTLQVDRTGNLADAELVTIAPAAAVAA